MNAKTYGYTGSIRPIEIEGVGPGLRLTLSAHHGEDGWVDEYEAEFTDERREDAENLLAFWQTGGARMVYAAVALRPVGSPDDAPF